LVDLHGAVGRAGGAALLQAWIAEVMGCGEVCSGSGWQGDRSAWLEAQWGLMLPAALLLLIGTQVALRGRSRVGGALIAAAVALYLVWVAAVGEHVSIR
jgi:hypothetical protein